VPDVLESLLLRLEPFKLVNSLTLLHTSSLERLPDSPLQLELYELAEQFDDPTYRQEAHYSLGHTLYLLGDITAAYRHLQRGIALVAPEQPHSVIMGLMNRDVAAHCCWLLGYPAQAQVYVREALETAQKQSDPLNVVHALY